MQQGGPPGGYQYPPPYSAAGYPPPAQQQQSPYGYAPAPGAPPPYGGYPPPSMPGVPPLYGAGPAPGVGGGGGGGWGGPAGPAPTGYAGVPQYGGPPPQAAYYGGPAGYPPPQHQQQPQPAPYGVYAPSTQQAYPPPPPSSQGAPWGQDYFRMIQAQEMAELQRWFDGADRDRNGSLSATELQQRQWSGQRFSLSTCRMLVKVFDRKQTGEISYDQALHKFVTSMEAAFKKFDGDRNGRLDKLEITNALREGGFHFNPATANTLMRKFATPASGSTTNKSRPSPATATLTLESFIQLCAFLGSCRSTFQWTDTDKDGYVELTPAQFIGIAAAF